jgi:hypothetical protein
MITIKYIFIMMYKNLGINLMYLLQDKLKSKSNDGFIILNFFNIEIQKY